MVCHHEDSKVDNRPGNEDQEIRTVVLSELVDEDTDYLDG